MVLSARCGMRRMKCSVSVLSTQKIEADSELDIWDLSGRRAAPGQSLVGSTEVFDFPGHAVVRHYRSGRGMSNESTFHQNVSKKAFFFDTSSYQSTSSRYARRLSNFTLRKC